jgi:uncharacterized protein YdeI (YjbR/CyaY-like superfamily)
MVRFEAELFAAGENATWRCITVPFNVKDAFGTGGLVRVRGTVNGHAIQTAIFPRGDGTHMLMINKAMQKATGIRDAGDIVRVELEADVQPRKVPVAAELAAELKKSPAARACFETLSYSFQKAFAEKVSRAKPALRRQRARATAASLAELHAAFRQPPPVLKRLLGKSPEAQARFAKLGTARKREYLWYILDAKSAETRERRAKKVFAKLVEPG